MIPKAKTRDRLVSYFFLLLLSGVYCRAHRGDIATATRFRSRCSPCLPQHTCVRPCSRKVAACATPKHRPPPVHSSGQPALSRISRKMVDAMAREAYRLSERI